MSRKPSPSEDLDEMLRLAAGRRFFRRWLDTMQVEADVFHTDPLIMARNTGLKLAGINLLRQIRDDHPELYAMMLREQAQEADEAQADT